MGHPASRPNRNGSLPAPLLLLLKGNPGTGKSTVAARLSREFGWPLIDKDAIQDSLDQHLDASTAPAYEIMFRVAHRQLLQGLSVVCDSPLWEETYRQAQAVAASCGARLAVIECRCSDEVLWRGRIERRQGMQLPPRRTVTWQGLEAYRTRFEAETFTISAPHLIVDTADDLTQIVADIQTWLLQLAADDGSAQREWSGQIPQR